MERGLIVGASGSGKTTIIQHIIARRPGDVLVLDPHDDTVTWPSNAQVVGGGQDYTAIESALLDLDVQYSEGWSFKSFEETFKRHMTLSKSKLQKLFTHLRQQGDVQECSPGLFKTVRGFERY